MTMTTTKTTATETTRVLNTVSEIADAIGVSRSGLYNLIRQHRVPFYRFGETIRLDLAEVLRATRMEAENSERPSGLQPVARSKPAKTLAK
jgi:excisionase family DNA binding protein